MINEINEFSINKNIKSVYPYREESLQELLSRFYREIKTSSDRSLQALDFMNWIISRGLKEEVVKQLNEMYQDGRLTELIDNLAGSLTEQIEMVDFDLRKLINDEVEDLVTKIDSDVSGVYSYVNTTFKDSIEEGMELLEKEIKEENPLLVLKYKYGIQGNGTDETAKLQTAINNEDIIVIPQDMVIGISSRLNINKTTQIISNGAKLLCLTEGLYSMMAIQNATGSKVDGIFFDMNLIGRTAIDVINSNEVTIKGCKFTGYNPNYGWYQTDGGIRLGSSSIITIVDNLFLHLGDGFGTQTDKLNRCIGVGFGCQDVLIDNNRFKYVSQAIVTDSEDIRITNNLFSNVDDNSVYCVGSSKNVKIEGNIFNENLDECIVLGGIKDYHISDNTFNDTVNKMVAFMSDIENVTIEGNVFNGITKSPANVIAYRDTTKTITNLSIINNVINVPFASVNDVIQLGNFIDLKFVNNTIKVFPTNNILGMRGTTIQDGLIRNNSFKSLSSVSSLYAFNHTVTPTTMNMIVENNILLNCRGGMKANITYRNGRMQNTGSSTFLVPGNGNSIYFSTVPANPLKGVKGDIIYNSSPASGQPFGWVCTDGDGTGLGTWSIIGNIS